MRLTRFYLVLFSNTAMGNVACPTWKSTTRIWLRLRCSTLWLTRLLSLFSLLSQPFLTVTLFDLSFRGLSLVRRGEPFLNRFFSLI